MFRPSSNARGAGMTKGHLLAAMFCTLLAAETTSAERIVVENRPDQAGDGVPVQVVAIRPITNLDLVQATELQETKFSEDLLLEAAAKIDELRPSIEKLRQSDLNASARLVALASIIVTSEYYKKQFLSGWQLTPGGFPVVESPYAIGGANANWDAESLVKFAGAGIIDLFNATETEVSGEIVTTVGFSPQYARPLEELYWKSVYLAGSSPDNVQDAFQGAKESLHGYSSLQQLLLANVGQIEFGYPIIYRATEKGLSIPDSLLNRFDVYWIDLAVDFREMDPADISEMVYNVGLPPGGIALELLPFRYGIEVNAKQTMRTPELSVGMKGAEVSLGEAYRREIAFSYLKPTVYARGLQRQTFSWVLRDEAISAGSHRFVAVVGMPQGLEGFNVDMSGHFRLKESWVGEWFDGELVAGTDIITIPVSF